MILKSRLRWILFTLASNVACWKSSFASWRDLLLTMLKTNPPNIILRCLDSITSLQIPQTGKSEGWTDVLLLCVPLFPRWKRNVIDPSGVANVLYWQGNSSNWWNTIFLSKSELEKTEPLIYKHVTLFSNY